MKVLITGIGGFVGPYLKQVFEDNHHIVFGIDRSGKNKSQAHFAVDILDKENLQKTIAHIKPDWVVHLAGFSSVAKSFLEPDRCKQINVVGTQNLIEACLALVKLPKMLVVSSSEVYGSPLSLPITEDYPMVPNNPYGVSRLEQEQMVKSYQGKISIVIARSFNHTGPSQPTGFVIPDFARQIVEIENKMRAPIFFVGNLLVKRDFTDVRDVVGAYYELVTKGTSGEVYNVCSGRSYSIESLLDMLIELSVINPEIIVDEVKLRPHEVSDKYGSNKKIADHIGWAPQIPIEQTLRDVLAWWRRTRL